MWYIHFLPLLDHFFPNSVEVKFDSEYVHRACHNNCFFFCRKSLDKGVLLYVHLNLAIALLAALVIFVAGIETADSVNVSSCSIDVLIIVF